MEIKRDYQKRIVNALTQSLIEFDFTTVYVFIKPMKRHNKKSSSSYIFFKEIWEYLFQNTIKSKNILVYNK